MKKLLNLILASVLIGVTCGGCDPHYVHECVVKNQLESSIVINIRHRDTGEIREAITIPPGKEQTIVRQSKYTDTTNVIPDYHSDPNYTMMGANAEMVVGQYIVSPDIWKRKHWTFFGKKGLAQYTLTVTAELLQSLETEIE